MQYHSRQDSTALHCTALHCTALHCTALHCTALHCTALHCTALHCTALHCTALHCSAVPWATFIHAPSTHTWLCQMKEYIMLFGIILAELTCCDIRIYHAASTLCIGGGDNRASTQSSFTHVTTNTWAHSEVFGFFRKNF